MATWEDLKGSLFAAGRDVTQKAKEVSEVAKLKMDIHTKEDFVEKQYAILGRVYYETNKDNVSERDAAQFNVIKEAIEEIERMTQQVLDIQGVIQCPNCGKKVPVGTCYCSDCGAKLEEFVADATIVSEETVVEEADAEVVEAPVAEEPAAEEVTVEEVVIEE